MITIGSREDCRGSSRSVEARSLSAPKPACRILNHEIGWRLSCDRADQQRINFNLSIADDLLPQRERLLPRCLRTYDRNLAAFSDATDGEVRVASAGVVIVS